MRTLTLGGRQALTQGEKESGTGHQHSLQLGTSSGTTTSLMDFWQQIVSAWAPVLGQDTMIPALRHFTQYVRKFEINILTVIAFSPKLRTLS